ncbi:MAG: pilus assembly protein PilP [Candidatus Tectomicrobia bacterium]|uniref:Pilus assembly protein PilP n=1 Tax=Tectimicrobiota bacterium TaxID=2528274 RepID=A0A937W8A9_UNCTE|nr:pilus assembly protein PilP [Candidatus Tectomicrobia bacterium]
MKRLQRQKKVVENKRRVSGPVWARCMRGMLVLGLLLTVLLGRVSAQEKPGARRPRPTAPPPPVEKVQEPVDNYRYDAQGRRDPLEPLVKESLPDVLRPKPRLPERPLGPLERFDLSALKLVGIVWGELGRRALIKAPDGKSYFATAETYMGKYSGKVIAIENDHLVIEEQYLNIEDKLVPKTLTIPLRRKDKREG